MVPALPVRPNHGRGVLPERLRLRGDQDTAPRAGGTERLGQVALCSIDPITQVNHSQARVAMPHDGILVVDSVFAFRPELNNHWDLRIWVEIDAELSVQRGTARDAPREGAETAETLHRDRYGDAEAIYMTDVDPRALADVVVDNSDFDQPRLIRV